VKLEVKVKNGIIEVQGREIGLVSQKDEDYISLTDMAKHKNPDATGLVISHWLSTRYTIEFIGLWESLNNECFNVTEFGNIRNESGSNSYVLTTKQWIQKTNAIGIIATPGRYGGTYAHKDIAFEFGSWISPSFKYFLIREFQRLKEQENERLKLEWNVQRTIAKINYRIHTDAIKDNLIPPEVSRYQVQFVYANEADILNMALFGMTAKEWREKNQSKSGNVRDEATLEQLVVLSNLESINSVLIHQNVGQSERLVQLNRIAISQMKSLVISKGMKKLKKK
jgi:hypothetical protein